MPWIKNKKIEKTSLINNKSIHKVMCIETCDSRSIQNNKMAEDSNKWWPVF